MQRRISRLPFLGFLLLFVVPILAVFLFARDGQNLKHLSRRLGVPIEDIERAPVEIRPVLQAPVSQPPPEEPPASRRTPSLVELLMAPPAPTGERSPHLTPMDPEKRCRSAGGRVQGAPEFVIVDGQWTCVMERRYPNSDDVFFLQVTGRGADVRVFRAKLNLYDGRALQLMVSGLADAFRKFEPVDPSYLAQRVRRAVDQDRQGETPLGYGRMLIQNEPGEARHVNIFIRPDTPKTAPPTPRSGFQLKEAIGRAQQ